MYIRGEEGRYSVLHYRGGYDVTLAQYLFPKLQRNDLERLRAVKHGDTSLVIPCKPNSDQSSFKFESEVAEFVAQNIDLRYLVSGGVYNCFEPGILIGILSSTTKAYEALLDRDLTEDERSLIATGFLTCKEPRRVYYSLEEFGFSVDQLIETPIPLNVTLDIVVENLKRGGFDEDESLRIALLVGRNSASIEALTRVISLEIAVDRVTKFESGKHLLTHEEQISVAQSNVFLAARACFTGASYQGQKDRQKLFRDALNVFRDLGGNPDSIEIENFIGAVNVVNKKVPEALFAIIDSCMGREVKPQLSIYSNAPIKSGFDSRDEFLRLYLDGFDGEEVVKRAVSYLLDGCDSNNYLAILTFGEGVAGTQYLKGILKALGDVEREYVASQDPDGTKFSLISNALDQVALALVANPDRNKPRFLRNVVNDASSIGVVARLVKLNAIPYENVGRKIFANQDGSDSSPEIEMSKEDVSNALERLSPFGDARHFTKIFKVEQTFLLNGSHLIGELSPNSFVDLRAGRVQQL